MAERTQKVKERNNDNCKMERRFRFSEWSCDERLMSPRTGKPVKVWLNHFSGWKANFQIAYTENVFNLNSIVNIINLTGFGLGIGSGRSSGYGRYHVTDVK